MGNDLNSEEITESLRSIAAHIWEAHVRLYQFRILGLELGEVSRNGFGFLQAGRTRNLLHLLEQRLQS